MKNNYEVPELIEIGNASHLIRGSEKPFPLVDDGIGQPKRVEAGSDDE